MIALALNLKVYQSGSMARHEALTDAVQALLDAWPYSRRDLATRAGVPHGTLTRIVKDQLGASPDVAARLLAALDKWQDEQRATAQAIADATQPVRQELLRADRSTHTEEA